MQHIRVLVVDDSAVVRRIVSAVLSAELGFEVVGTASDGASALEEIGRLRPSAVTLDVEMPEMDGIETLEHIRREQPDLPVVMLSSQTQKGASAALEALSRGASDYVAKPTARSLEEAMAQLSAELIPKLRQFFSAGPQVEAPVTVRETAVRPTGAGRKNPVEIVAFGASTGGPMALETVLQGLPSGFAPAIVITQHMPPVFTAMLAERLSHKTPIPVREGYEGAVVAPGTAWLAPGDFHMEVVRRGINVVITLHRQPPEHSCRPAVNPLFRSVAELYGAGAMGVVLTGMGQDGAEGAARMRAKGAHIIVQDAASSVVWGMPGTVANAGTAHEVLPLSEIAKTLHHHTMVRQGASLRGGGGNALSHATY